MWWDKTNRPAWLRYSVAAFAVAVAAAAHFALFQGPGAHGPFITFFPAVCIAAMFGGLFPGLLATVLSVAYNLILWNPAPYHIDLSVFVIFVGTGIVVSLFASALDRAEARAHEADKKAALAAEREQAAVAIQESEEHWKRTFDTVPDLIAILDMSHRIVKVNREMARRLGMAPEGCIGLTCYQCMHGLFHPIEACPHLKTMQDGREHEAELYEERLDGFFHVSTTPLHDEQGRMVGAVHVARDITERRKAEEALKESEEKLRSILGVVPVGIGLTVDRVIREANDQLCEMTGYSKAELIDAEVRGLYPSEEEYERLGAPRCGQVCDKGSGAVETVWKKKDGTLINVLLSCIPVTVSDLSQGVTFTALDITERKQAEDALRESEREFVAMFERAAVGKSLSDPATNRMLRVNKAFADMLGYSVEELCRMTFVEITHPEDREENLAGYDKVREGVADKWQIEKRYIRKDGSIVWADVSGSLIRYEDGRPERTLAVIQDITQRKLMEEELRKSRLELESRVGERTAELVRANDELRSKTEIIDFAHDAIIIRDLEGAITFWNNGARETYGFSRDCAVGQVVHALLKTEFPLPLDEIIGTVLENGEWKGEIKQTKANGEHMVVDSRWAAQLGKDGQPVGFLEVNRDITARKLSDEELRKADRAFRTLSEFNQAMVRQTDEMELLKQACRIVAEVGGYRLVWVGFAKNDEDKSVVPVASAGFNDDGYLARAKITWADNERGRGPCGVSIRTGRTCISQNSETNRAFAPWRFEAARRGIASSISLPLIVEGNVIGALGIYASEPDAFDLAESNLLNDLAQNLSYGIASIRSDRKRRNSEESLRVYASRLELINSELQEFAFVAAHDLQEPLRKVQTFCDMAMKRCASSLDLTSKEYLTKAINSATRMRELLHDMLQFSRVAAKIGPVKEIDLPKIVREAADVFETSIKETGCRIVIDDMPSIEADASQISRLFQNLFENALKFRSDRTPCIKVYNESEPGGFCRVFVEDNGIGFDQQFAEQIFKPFERLHVYGGYKGAGMGLAICRKIAERHGGTISVESRQGVGSTFMVRLPVKQAGVQRGTDAQ